jgi:hypothetical protein
MSTATGLFVPTSSCKRTDIAAVVLTVLQTVRDLEVRVVRPMPALARTCVPPGLRKMAQDYERHRRALLRASREVVTEQIAEDGGVRQGSRSMTYSPQGSIAFGVFAIHESVSIAVPSINSATERAGSSSGMATRHRTSRSVECWHRKASSAAGSPA